MLPPAHPAGSIYTNICFPNIKIYTIILYCERHPVGIIYLCNITIISIIVVITIVIIVIIVTISIIIICYILGGPAPDRRGPGRFTITALTITALQEAQLSSAASLSRGTAR